MLREPTSLAGPEFMACPITTSSLNSRIVLRTNKRSQRVCTELLTQFIMRNCEPGNSFLGMGSVIVQGRHEPIVAKSVSHSNVSGPQHLRIILRKDFLTIHFLSREIGISMPALADHVCCGYANGWRAAKLSEGESRFRGSESHGTARRSRTRTKVVTGYDQG